MKASRMGIAAAVAAAATGFSIVAATPAQAHPGACVSYLQHHEVIYVISGEAMQMVDDGEPFAIKEGDAVYIPKGVWHSTYNETWRSLRLIVTYTPGGEEKALEAAPDYRLHDAGTVPEWRPA